MLLSGAAARLPLLQGSPCFLATVVSDFTFSHTTSPLQVEGLKGRLAARDKLLAAKSAEEQQLRAGMKVLSEAAPPVLTGHVSSLLPY
jgi:hypothetical protein